MNESRKQQILAGQSTTARKVFDMVPIQEAWREGEITASLRTAGVTVASVHVIRACLNQLKEAGLIREVAQGQFQRSSPKQPIAQPIASEPTMSQVVNKPKLTPLDQLGAVAAELTIMAVEFENRIKGLAHKIEEIGLSVEEQRETESASMIKAQKIQALLKEVMTQ